MDNTVYTVHTINDILYYLKNSPTLKVYGGCTGVDITRSTHTVELENRSVITRGVAELSRINKTARYIEFGSAVTLSQIASIDRKWIPEGLFEAIQSIGNPYTGNLATIAGNICTKKHKMSCFSPLLAHDARLAVRTMSRNMADETYFSLAKMQDIPERSFVTRIRIPLEEWSISVYKKIGGDARLTDSANFMFLANTQKAMLSDVRIAFCGSFAFRNRELENALIGNKLPLSEKSITSFVEIAKKYFIDYCEKEEINIPPMYYAYFTNLVFDSLRNLS